MVTPEAFAFADDGTIPNSALPLLVYPRAFELPTGTDAAEVALGHLAANGWTRGWVNGVYPFHHFHSTAHEVLAVVAGQATVRFGGPQGRSLELGPGDVVAIPAGVGHCRERASHGFTVVGAYAQGRDWDLCRGEPGQKDQVRANITRVPLPRQDPVNGPAGPLLELWRAPAT